MGKQLSRLVAGLTLAVMMTACARAPMRAPNRAPGTAPGQTGLAPGTVNRGGVTGGGTTGTHMLGGGGGGTTGVGGTAGPTTFGATGTTAARLDLGRQISFYVAGLDGIGGAGTGTPAGTTGTATAPGTTTTGGTAAGGTVTGPAGTVTTLRPVGVSTLIVGNVAYIGIDASTLPAGTLGGTFGGGGGTFGAGRAVYGPGTPGTAVSTAGFYGFLRDRIRTRFPEVSDVFVTTEPVTVYRIARATAGGTTTVDVSDVITVIRTMTPGATRTR